MGYYTLSELNNIGFKVVGNNVKISTKASIYNPELMEIGDHSRIDDFCVISGKVKIGKHVHIAPLCLVAGGEKGIQIADFAGLAYGVQVFSQSDDYSGQSMTNPTVPTKYKNETKRPVLIERHCIIGAGSIILPGVSIKEGTAVGAMSLVRKSTEEWSIYLGNPAKKIKTRSKNLLELENEFLRESNDSV